MFNTQLRVMLKGSADEIEDIVGKIKTNHSSIEHHLKVGDNLELEVNELQLELDYLLEEIYRTKKEK